jgi:hypothetical protein
VSKQAYAESVDELAVPELLRNEVDRAFAGATPRYVAIGFQSGARSACVAWRENAASSQSDPSRAAIRVGCIAKLLTATLARRAIDARRFAPDERVSDLLAPGAARRALRGITVRQLLEHSHGLDDSLLSSAPTDGRGRVDTEKLVRELRAVAPLASPGTLYSYGNLGACVVAALLERIDSRPYSEQLVEALLEPLGLGAIDCAGPICPATGGELALCTSELLSLVADAAFAAPDVWPDDECAGDYGFATPLPGWNPLERGVYLGWKYHGAGWLGHQSVWPGHSVFVRAHPRRRLALVVASDHAAAVVAAGVFGSCLAELFQLKVPARTNASLVPPTGTYGSAAWRVEIQQLDGEHKLRARQFDQLDESSAGLRVVAPGLWLTKPALLMFPHVELVELDRAYLWNGKFVLPRAAR